ncbi:MAG TPA: MATE family efflux transporter [Clostridiaceae bacterium]|nr:MATE family efflux transporter [Clostridiaceae bacterium]
MARLKSNIDLTSGDIFGTLTKLALPIMGTSFIQMAYNLTDMMWVGKIGSGAVAAVGTAGFFLWLAEAIIILCRIGAQVFVAQSLGEKNLENAKQFAQNSIQLSLFLAILYSCFVFFLRHELIGFFKLGDVTVINMAVTYLSVVVTGLGFTFINPVFTAIFNGAGNSRIPFLINTIGLVTNIILDPVLIFGIGPFPRMDVAGAALATVFAQFVVTVIYIIALKKQDESYFKVNLFKKVDLSKIKAIIKLGLPVAAQEGIFALIAMVISRIVASYGPTAVAVQKVGAQIESLSWMTAGGFSTALGAFVGQNFGAKKYERIIKGYKSALLSACSIGFFATILFIFFGGPIFEVFLHEKDAIDMGIVYLRVLSISQCFMCLEITTQGAFNGLGKTSIPSAVGIVFNALRIPAAWILSSYTPLKLNGIWWAISLSSVFKGTVLSSLFYLIVINKYDKNGIISYDSQVQDESSEGLE